MKKFLTVTAVAATALVLGTTGGAVAGSLITSADIKNGTIQSVDVENGELRSRDILDDGVKEKDLAYAVQNKINHPAGLDGAPGVDGQDGADSLVNAYYATAEYDAGDTNAGAIATVACQAETDVALAGGVQSLGLGGHPAAVASSFPGRMDWATNTPKADRLDGWIVQFDATTAPEKVTLYALCVPGADVSVVNTFKQTG